jgi:DNA-binding NtrC family response regulator
MQVDVAVINTSEEIAEVLELLFQLEGLTTARAYVVDFKRGRQDLTAFLTEHDPRIIIWDIAIPYQENWEYLQKAWRLPAMQARPIILTSTNERAVQELVGAVDIIEIVGRPFDQQVLLRAVQRALHQEEDEEDEAAG